MSTPSIAQTKTPGDVVPLHRYGGDMRTPYRILGHFWEIDEEGEPISGVHSGILEWDPAKQIKSLTLFNEDENSIKKTLGGLADNLHPVCLHGVAIQNLDSGNTETMRFSIDAYRSGSSVTQGFAAKYSQAVNNYQINNIWSGSSSVNLHSARYTQMAFTFKGLEKWVRHLPEIKLSSGSEKDLFIDSLEADILRDVVIPNIGRLKIICGHNTHGSYYNQTLAVEQQWQIDFDKSEAKTYTECLDILSAAWNCINIAIGSVVPLQYLILTCGDTEIKHPERFFVRMAHTTADSEGSRAAEILAQHRDYIPFSELSGDVWKRWISVSMDPAEKDFSDYVTLLTAVHRIPNMPQEYEVLTLVTVIEAMVKEMTGHTDRGFPKKEFRELVKRNTPGIFPDGILDVKMEGHQGLLDWVIQNRNTRIAHIGFPDAVNSYNYPAGIYAERVLRLIAISLLMWDRGILSTDQIKKFFWECNHTKQELAYTPDKSVRLSIFADK